MTNSYIQSSELDLGPKQLTPWGVSVANYRSSQDAAGYVYTTRDGNLPPTPFISPINPFNQEILDAKNVLEIGGGVGRNLPFVMEKTNAYYTSVDPNVEMTKYFWDIQDPKWKNRVSLYENFSSLNQNIRFDFVIVTFVFQHIGFRPSSVVMNVSDITKEAMNYTKDGTVWFLLEHEREEIWQNRWLSEINISPTVYFKPGGTPIGGGKIPYPEFELMTHRGNDHNIIIFKEHK